MVRSWFGERPRKRSGGQGRRPRSPDCLPRVEGFDERICPSFGTAALAVPINHFLTAAAVGDLNGDGRDDLIVANPNMTLGVLLGNGDNTFQAEMDSPLVGPPNHLATGDFNGDGRLDVATDVGMLFLGNGGGTFRGPGIDSPFPVLPGPLAAGDFNGDGKLDVAFTTGSTNGVGPSVGLVLGNGDGTFGTPQTVATFAAGTRPVSLAAGDFDGDGKLDLVTGTQGTAAVLLGNGDGTFQAAKDLDSAPAVTCAVADLNGDGKPDLVVSNVASTATLTPSTTAVYLGNGDGPFRLGGSYAVGGALGVADFDGDGRPDIAAGLTSAPATTAVLHNNGDWHADYAGAVGFRLGAPPMTTTGLPFAVTVTAVDAAGNPVAGFRGTVHLASSDPAAALVGDYTFTAADAGTHTFAGNLGLRLYTPGSQTVTAEAPALAPATAGVAVFMPSLAVTAPGSTPAGTAITFTVTVRDTAGNPLPGYTGTVSFATGDGQADLPAGYAFTAADAGVHTFTATLRTAGPQVIVVTDAAAGASARAPAVTVTPLAASALRLALSDAYVGNPASGTVWAVDAYGNLATSYGGTVHFTSTDPRATSAGDVTLVNGTGPFTETLGTAGAQSVTAADTADPSITGAGGVGVQHVTAQLFTVTGFPATTAGAAQTFRVTAKDFNGHVATEFTGTVTFIRSDAQAGLPASYTFTAADGGTHVFTATLRTAGAHSITAVDSFDGVFGRQAAIAVAPAAAASFVVAGFPATAAGVAQSFTLTARDAFGNVAVAYRGKAHFGSTDGKAGLPSDYTFGAGDIGVRTFSVTLNTAGLQTLLVTDTANNTIKGSTGVTVSAAATGGGGGGGGGGGSGSGGGGA